MVKQFMLMGACIWLDKLSILTINKLNNKGSKCQKMFQAKLKR